ncbi:hypothetical protein [Siphonobacter sp. SORGH_AS_1065]|uniref:hypothetical protein n=1 Tax=Siphonobacter sp. SORGH_AS_1065 TaxID=3041795 RepID=UPI00277F1F6A|nr:hypothetical protein [Siphonobacter sp. SORGH_AS_1065]MDQ1089012.1 hypothetical protein [Siphonobacter sp. SORGH_AS_1065]
MTKELAQAAAKEKALVKYLTGLVALRLLADSNLKGAVGKQVEDFKQKAFAGLSQEELKPIILSTDVIQNLALHLVRCKDVATLEQSVSYAEGLLRGEVLIVQDDGDTLKRNAS